MLKGKEIRSGQDRYSVLGARPFPSLLSDNMFQAQPFTFIQMAGTRNIVSELRQVFIFLLLVLNLVACGLCAQHTQDCGTSKEEK